MEMLAGASASSTSIAPLSSSLSFPKRTDSAFTSPFLIHLKEHRRLEVLRVSENAMNASNEYSPSKMPKESKLWGGRFEETVTDAVEKFTESISFDKALYKQDIMGSKAHATMLAHQVLSSFVSCLPKRLFYCLSASLIADKSEKMTEALLEELTYFSMMILFFQSNVLNIMFLVLHSFSKQTETLTLDC